MQRRCVVLAISVILAVLHTAAVDASTILQDALIRSLDDVTPALQNATSSAIAGARTIADSYADLIIAIGIRTFHNSLFFKNRGAKVC